MANDDSRQGSLPLGDPYSNRGLFADRYLTGEERLLSLPEWCEAAGVEEAFEAIRGLYEERAAGFTEGTNEAQTEADFIRPVLDALGWEYEVQEPIAGVNRTPDYALLTSGEDKEQIQPLKGTPELWEHVAVVGDAKRWQQDLDRRRADETPSIQITNYLYRSRVRWGILTNGRHWRLYEQDKARGGDTYYEVDLVDLLQAGKLEQFKYFLLFFRRDAFVPVRDEKSFVELVFEGSERYRTEVGDDLKEAVYDALRMLMNGFLAFERNGLDAEDEDQLKQVHDLSLTVLYRLLFLLYAEDKDLLPAKDQPYRDYSLLKAQQDINRRLRARQSYSPGAGGLWHHFLDICHLIDNGLAEGDRWVIPAYNGGLFSCERYPEIAYEPQPHAPRWEIGDAYLAEAIDQVAYRRERWDEPTADDVDYATLDVQHLGAIYEGLLELKPQVAEEPMIEQPGPSGKPPVVKKKSEVNKPKKVRGQPPREFAPGETYLVTDRGERKATGSYYTPKYIVDYIVEHTVGELAEEAAAQVRERWQEIAAEHGCERPDDLDELIAAAEDGTKRERLREKRRSLLEPYLSLKVLDPAMGSGHFLVGAADYLSLAMATDPYLPPVPEEEAHEQQAHYKRLVVQHCLFGVDLNPLAVELAKLSLWLHTVSRDKALSFLDHHLRCGNSLIGARLDDDLSKPPPAVGGGEQEAEGPQLAMRFDATLERNDLVAFLDAFRRIVEAPVGDAEVERQKDAWYREMDERRDPYRQVANLWLAPYFGVEVTPTQYGSALEALRAGRGSDQWRGLTEHDWFQAAQRTGGPDGRRFFHWELEFPEAFFHVQQSRADWKPEKQRGFDAVVGNPPYYNLQTRKETPEVRTFLPSGFPEVYRGKADIHYFFLALASRLTAPLHPTALITSSYFLQAYYADRTRRHLLTASLMDRILSFGARQVFEGVGVHTCILTRHRAESGWPHCGQSVEVLRVQGARGDDPEIIAVCLNDLDKAQDAGLVRHADVCQDDLDGGPWAIGGIYDIVPDTVRLTTLDTLCHVGKGIATGDDEVFVLEAQRARELRLEDGHLLPVIHDEDLQRYHNAVSDDVVIATPRGCDLSRMPNIHAYLEPHRERLLERYAVENEGVEWHEVVRLNEDLFGDQVTEQLFFHYRSERMRASVTEGRGASLTTSFAATRRETSRPAPLFLCAIANSQLMHDEYVVRRAKTQGTAFEMSSDLISNMPVVDLDFRVTTAERELSRLMAMSEDLLAAGRLEQVVVVSRRALVAHSLAVGRELPPWTHEHFSEEEIEELRDFPGREDFVHDLLAELAQRMIDLNKHKHDLIERFEADLRGLADPETAEKLQKGKQARTLFKHESCQPFMQEGSHSTHHLPESLAWSEEAFEVFVRELGGKVPNLSDLLAAYGDYTDDYRGLTEALTRTDELIDQIFYALYGLTEEDIAIVEASTNS